jgi:hypothetical protein
VQRPCLLSEEIPAPYNRPFPFHRLVLCRTQRSFPFDAGVVLIISDGVGNLKVAVACAMEAGRITGTIRLLRWGCADRANEEHGSQTIVRRKGQIKLGAWLNGSQPPNQNCANDNDNDKQNSHAPKKFCRLRSNVTICDASAIIEEISVGYYRAANRGNCAGSATKSMVKPPLGSYAKSMARILRKAAPMMKSCSMCCGSGHRFGG